nr:retrovirus-related Pol polyprotein from transposon TNT 1-94 [Tanacetum cinerariifolium]
MTMTKFDIEKFDGKNDFELWQVRMKDLLKQQGLPAALEELPVAMIVAYDNNKLYTFHMHPGKSRSEHIDELHKLVGDLAAIDIVISDEDQVRLFLTSLPSSYDKFMETLLYVRDTLKLEDVLATLNSRELQKMTNAKGDGGKGLYVRRRSGQRDMEQGTDSTTYPVLELMGMIDVMMAMSVEELLDWIIDSRGSYRITYKIDYLFDFEEYDGDDVTSNVVLYKNIGFNESGEYKKTFVGSGVDTGSVHVLQGVKFEVEPLEDHTFEVEPYANVDHIVVVTVDKIYAHDSLTFNNIGACEVISKWKARLKDDTDARSDVEIWATKGLLDKAKGNVLGMEIVKDQSDRRTCFFVNFDYAMGRLITIMGTSITSGVYDTYGGCKGGYLAKWTRNRVRIRAKDSSGYCYRFLVKGYPWFEVPAYVEFAEYQYRLIWY